MSIALCKIAPKKSYFQKTENIRNFPVFGFKFLFLLNNFFRCTFALRQVYFFEIYEKLQVFSTHHGGFLWKKIPTLLRGFFAFLKSKNAPALVVYLNTKIVFSKYVLGLLSLAESEWSNSKFKNRRPLLYSTGIYGTSVSFPCHWSLDSFIGF